MLLLAKMNKISLGVFLLNFCSTSEQSGSRRENEISPSLTSLQLYSFFPDRLEILWILLTLASPMLVLEGEEVNTLCGWWQGRPLLLQTRSFVKLSCFCLSWMVCGMMRTHEEGKILGNTLTQSKCFCCAQSCLNTCSPTSVSAL